MSSETSGACAICQKESFSKCARCRNVFYCSVDHQREHWIGGHREKCSPLPSTASSSSSLQPKATNFNFLKSNTKKYAEAEKTELTTAEPKQRQRLQEKGAGVATTTTTTVTSSLVNRNGENATLLRQNMSAAYYDAAEEAFKLVLSFQMSSEDIKETNNINTKQAVEDFVRSRLEIVNSARISASLANVENRLTVGEMLRNGTIAAQSLLRGRTHNVPSTSVPRDPQMADIYARIEAAIPSEVPMSYFCGFAEATLEAQIMLRELWLERNHNDPLLVAAAATCMATYIVAQDRIRSRLEKHARGAAEHPEVVEQLDRLKTIQRGE